MREVVYLILGLVSTPLAGAMEAHKPHPNGPERRGAPSRLDLRVAVSDAPSRPGFQPAAPMTARDRVPGPSGSGTGSAPTDTLGALA